MVNRYVDQMFNETTARTTLTQMLEGVGTTAGKYSPLFNGVLEMVRIIVTPQAATSLMQAAHVILTQTEWKPNAITFPFSGYGLATAPQAIGGPDLQLDFPVELMVQTDKPIDGELIEFDSPVTPRIRVLGFFRS